MHKPLTFKINIVSETNLIIYFGNEIDVDLAIKIGAISQRIRDEFKPQLIEVIPSYTSVLIEFNPLEICHSQLISKLEDYLNQAQTTDKAYINNYSKTCSKTIELPAYYDLEVGPDLANIARLSGLNIKQIIEIHSQTTYTVCAIGFAPGFAFLANVNAQIAIHRHPKPRIKVPAGSLGIANEQTAVYPQASPAGWQIIANCPVPLFNPTAQPMTPFNVGDKVKFQPIDKTTFLKMGGEICQAWD